MCVGSKQIERGLTRVGLMDVCGEAKTRCHQVDERKSKVCRMYLQDNYRKVCRKYLQGKLSQGMWGVLAR